MLKQLGMSALIAGMSFACAHQNEDYRPAEVAQQTPVLVEPPPPPAPAVPPAAAPTTPTAPAVRAPAAAKAAPQPKAGRIEALVLSEPLTPPVRRMLAQGEDSLRKGDINAARSFADRAFRLALHDPRTAYLQARIAEREKSYEDAEQWAFRALENLDSAEQQKVIWGFIAVCRDKSGDKKGLVEALRERDQL